MNDIVSSSTSAAKSSGSPVLPDIAAPEVAAWERLVDAHAGGEFTKAGDADPFIRVPRPVWADPEIWNGETTGSHHDRWWRSTPVAIPFASDRDRPVALGMVQHATYGVLAMRPAIAGADLVEVRIQHPGSDPSSRLTMSPANARRVADAILAAARLLDPHEEFDQAG